MAKLIKNVDFGKDKKQFRKKEFSTCLSFYLLSINKIWNFCTFANQAPLYEHKTSCHRQNRQ